MRNSEGVTQDAAGTETRPALITRHTVADNAVQCNQRSDGKRMQQQGIDGRLNRQNVITHGVSSLMQRWRRRATNRRRPRTQQTHAGAQSGTITVA